ACGPADRSTRPARGWLRWRTIRRDSLPRVRRLLPVFRDFLSPLRVPPLLRISLPAVLPLRIQSPLSVRLPGLPVVSVNELRPPDRPEYGIDAGHRLNLGNSARAARAARAERRLHEGNSERSRQTGLHAQPVLAGPTDAHHCSVAR